MARNATSCGRLGRRLLGRSWRRFANGDRRGRDGAAHSRHLKPGSARDCSPKAQLASGVSALVLATVCACQRWRYPRLVPVTTISTSDCHSENRRAGSRQSRTGRCGAIPSSHLGGIGLDLMAAVAAPHDQQDTGRSSIAGHHRWVW
jgi:hypothetical protein